MNSKYKTASPKCDLSLSRRQFLQAGALGLGALACHGLPLPALGQDVRHGYTRPSPAVHWTLLANGNIRGDAAPGSAKSWTATGGNAASGRTGAANMSPWPTATPPPSTSIPLKKNRSSTSSPAPVPIPLPPPAADLHCKFCQNWEISQARPEETFNFDLAPAAIVQAARETSCPSIAHTYVEPMVFYEYMLEIARLSKAAGIINVCHSSGYINPQPLKELCPHIQAACVDLKGFTDNFYKEMVDATLTLVLRKSENFSEAGCPPRDRQSGDPPVQRQSQRSGKNVCLDQG